MPPALEDSKSIDTSSQRLAAAVERGSHSSMRDVLDIWGPPPAREHTPASKADRLSTERTRLQDFVAAAGQHATDLDSYKRYAQSELDKLIGIGEGLNVAKEETKRTVAAAWQSMTDGTAADFLSKPNAINEPLFKAAGNLIDALAMDPNATNNAVTKLGRLIMEGSEHYSTLPDREKGKVIGEAMFGMVNPEGSPEAGQLAFKLADSACTQIDKAVEQAVRQQIKAIATMTKESPEFARQAKEMLRDYLEAKGLGAAQTEAAGVPRAFFNDVRPTAAVRDNQFAMSKADDLDGEAAPKRKNQSKKEDVPTGDAIAEHFRCVAPTESLDKVCEEMSELSRSSGREYALVKRPDGKLEIMHGSADRMMFIEPIRESVAHPHLNNSFVLSGHDIEMLKALHQDSTVIINAHTGEFKRVSL